MLPYTQTEPVTRLQAEIAHLQAERSKVFSVKGCSARSQQLAATINTRKKQLARLLSHPETLTRPKLVELWIAAFDRLWTPEEQQLFRLERAGHEGRGEKSVRHRLGYPIVDTRESCDLPDGSEVKFIGRWVDDFRLGKVGKRWYFRALHTLQEADVTDDMLDGEVSSTKLYKELPQPVRALLQTSMAPSRVLDCYSAMYLTTDQGFGKVIRRDYERAFRLTHITQGSPKYRLKSDYVVEQLYSTLPTDQQPKVVTEQPLVGPLG